MRCAAIVVFGGVVMVSVPGCLTSKGNFGENDYEGPIPDAVVTCTRVHRPKFWSGPYYVWKGQNGGQAPLCPAIPVTAGEAQDWYADLDPPPACAPCLCAPSTGKCELSSKLTAHDVPCADVAQNHKDFAFDAPPAWDGKCDSSATIPAGMAKSVTIEPITVTQESCAPLDTVPARVAFPEARTVPASAWKTLVRSCEGWGWIPLENPETWCIPDYPPPPEGFRLCIAHEGEQPECDPLWPEKMVAYDGADDNRECTECHCTQPVGGICTATASLDEDPACAVPVKQGIGISSAMSICVDINPSVQSLVSKSVTSLTYLSGTCEPGRFQVKGTLVKTGAVTLCCQR